MVKMHNAPDTTILHGLFNVARYRGDDYKNPYFLHYLK